MRLLAADFGRQHCVTCTTNDPDNKSGSTPLSYYNGFVNQCISLSAASGSDLVSISGQQVTTARALTTLDQASASTIAPAILSSGLKALTASVVTSSSLVSAPSGMSRAPITSSPSATPSQTMPSSGSDSLNCRALVTLVVAFIVSFMV
ncbi:hypothetical protein OIV83_003306 [Microbotryomycetes sp. JL201]|nr:hypothetical protein OIV83_003306 [Microbotryomycetes sp. JL201]